MTAVVDREAPGSAPDVDPGRRHPVARRVAKVAVLVLAALAAYVAITFVQVWRASASDDPSPAAAVVVLGAAQYDGDPSPALEARLRHALDLYRDGVAPRIVVTGGRRDGDRFTEATSGYNWLRDRGVPDAHILKEVQGSTTYESLAATHRFLAERGWSDVVLVSSPAHSARVAAVAAEVGLDGHVSPAGTGADLRSLARETLAVAAGRVIGFRRLDNLLG